MYITVKQLASVFDSINNDGISREQVNKMVIEYAKENQENSRKNNKTGDNKK